MYGTKFAAKMLAAKNLSNKVFRSNVASSLFSFSTAAKRISPLPSQELIPPLNTFLPPFENRKPPEISVGVGLSGGVDSCVTAYILKQYGFNLTAIFMINWNQKDYDNNTNNIKNKDYCYESELNDVRDLCSKNKLNIPLKIIKFDNDYYNKIFTNYINDLSSGYFTPNPDANCSKFISFGKLHEYIKNNLNCDFIATGHWASIKWIKQNNDNEYIPYLKESKEIKFDQTYFLSRINCNCLYNHIFPIGNYYTNKKEQIRIIANEYIKNNDKISNKRSSTGMCYVGPINHSQFLNKYIDHNFGEIIDCYGRKLGKHKGLSFYTIGQKLKYDDKYDIFNKLCNEYYIKQNIMLYVLDKDIKLNQLIVTTYSHDLFLNNYIIGYKWNWLINTDNIKNDKIIYGKFRFRDKDILLDGYLKFSNDINDEFGHIYLINNNYVRAATPGQLVVMYNNHNICIASALIHSIIQ